MEEDKILVTVSGPDRPGITQHLMEILSNSDTSIYDIGQAVTYGFLSLSFVTKVSKDKSQVLKELLFSTSENGLQMTYQSLDKAIGDKVIEPGKKENRFMLNCASIVSLTTAFICDLSKVLANMDVNILRIDNPRPGLFHCLEITATLPQKTDTKTLKIKLLEVSSKHKVDISLLKDSIYRRQWKLFAFDMDSTLIQNEVIDEIAKMAGVGDKVAAITKKAMGGEIDFEQSLRERVSHLAGVEEKVLDTVYSKLTLTEGAKDLIETIQHLGYKTAIISGGFTVFADKFKGNLGLSYAFANDLEIVDGKLTGGLVGDIITPTRKAEILKELANKEGITIEQTVAIGDGANDLMMLSTAGLGIAYHAKEIVKRSAEHNMSYGPITSILQLMGIST